MKPVYLFCCLFFIGNFLSLKGQEHCLFPVYGITLGVTTFDDVDKEEYNYQLNFEETQFRYYKEIYFWDHNYIGTKVYLYSYFCIQKRIQ